MLFPVFSFKNTSRILTHAAIRSEHYLFHKTKPPDRDLPAEVRALEAFLQKTGGPYGGWDQYDHQAFLKVRHYCHLFLITCVVVGMF